MILSQTQPPRIMLITLFLWLAFTSCNSNESSEPVDDLSLVEQSQYINVSATHLESIRLDDNSMDGHAIDFYDINQDGWLDIISGNRFNGEVCWF